MKPNALINSRHFNLKVLCSGFLFLLFFSACETEKKEENPPVTITAEHEAALKEYFDLDIAFSDTLIRYEITDDKLVLDMGNSPIKSWNITAFWMKSKTSEAFNTKMNKAYFREGSNFIALDLPEEYDKELHKDVKIKLGLSHRGISYISNYESRSATLTSFFYEQAEGNTFKPEGEEWNKMKYIKHRVNYMDGDNYPFEIKEFLSQREAEIIQKLKFIKS